MNSQMIRIMEEGVEEEPLCRNVNNFVKQERDVQYLLINLFQDNAGLKQALLAGNFRRVLYQENNTALKIFDTHFLCSGVSKSK